MEHNAMRGAHTCVPQLKWYSHHNIPHAYNGYFILSIFLALPYPPQP